MYTRFALRRHLVALLMACSILSFVTACGADDEAAAPASTPTRVTRFSSPPSPTDTPITTNTTPPPTPFPTREWNLEDIQVDGSIITVSLRVFAGIDVWATLDGKPADEVRPTLPTIEYVFRNVIPGKYTVEVRDVVGHSETTEVVAPTFSTSTSTPSPTEVLAVQDWVSYPSLNDIRSVAFASDGSLWAGTGSGVVRWDLATETHLRYSTADGLASDDVTDLAFAPDGTLWVAARGGVSRFDGTGWTSYTEADGLISNIVYDITVTPDGSVWVGTQNGASHFDCKRSGAVWTSYTMADGLADNVVWYVAVSPDGDVWFSTHVGGVSRYSPGQDAWTTYSTEHGLPLPNARFLTIGPDGAPWLHIGYDHVYRFDGVTWQVAYEAGGGQWVCGIAFDADNSPCIATCGGYHAYGAGLAHFDGTTWTYTTTADGLVDDDVFAVAVAADGTIAAGTDRGLSVYQAGRWRTLRSGPTLSRVTAIAVTPDGAAWFGFGDNAARSTGGGLSRFDGQSWHYVSQANGFPISDNVRALGVAPDGALWAGAGCGVARLENPTEAAGIGDAWQTIATCDDLHGNVLDIAFTPDGVAWVATGFGLVSFDGQSQTSYEKKAHSLAAAPDGAIWINGWEGLQGSDYVARFDGESWTTYQVADWFPGMFRVGAVTSDGRVWGIVPERGVACFDGQSWIDGQSWTFYPVSNQIFGLSVSPSGVLWAITDKGPTYFAGDVWESIQWDDGLGPINALAFAPDGSLWLGTATGAVHFRRSETVPTQSMKGYELYSWQVQGEWYFALVMGTNRIKSYDEIASPEVRVRGLETLKSKLHQLPSGEQVFWLTQRVPNMALPTDEMVDEIRAYCKQRGIELEVEPSTCSGPDAFPTEEAELIWPELRDVQPDQITPGDEVGILGVGGHLYWDNECGEFWLESARDFQLFFDSEPVGFITCYANRCVTNLTIPAGALSGTHVISVEGGSSLSIEVGGQPTPSPTPTAGTASPVSEATPTNTSTPSPTATEEADAAPVIHYFRANGCRYEEADPGDTIVLEWDSSGATSLPLTAILYHVTPSGQLPQSGWDVSPSGAYTYEISPDARNSSQFFLYVYDEAKRGASANLTVRLRCPDAWFFSPAPDVCASEAILSNAAEQHFEHGTMIWVEDTLWAEWKDRIFVLYDDDQPSPKWESFSDEWDEGEPDHDPTFTPPAGLYQPVRGFGLVWRERPNVRDRLGWAVDQETGFSTIMQSTTQFKYNSTYLRALDGRKRSGVWRLGPEMSSWEKIWVTEQSESPPAVPPTNTPPETSEPPVILSFAAEPMEVDPGGSVHLTWQSSGSVKAIIGQLLPGNVLREGLSVSTSGSTVVTIGENERHWHEFRLTVSSDAGQTAERSLTVQIRCPYEYFFPPPSSWESKRCPLRPAAFPQAAEQVFEQGRMIWLQEIPEESDGWGKARGPTIYVLYNYYVNGESTGGQLQEFDDTWTPGEPESNPSLAPPEGLYQPFRGFGKVWRNNLEVRERLGWALAPEQGYQGAYQVDWRDSYHVVGSRYVRTADDFIIIWLGELNNWGFLTP